ncbi:tmem145 [Symbiodinium sp. CCMP2592]|nr:tmem145 [Symbiodinium sp. CCMP2592]
MFAKVFAFWLAVAGVAAAPGSFRGGPGRVAARAVALEEIQASLQEALEGVLSSEAAAKRSAHIEARVWQTFQALPKNDVGRLAPKAVRYLVHSYFMKEHGWLIQGLDPHANQADVSEVHEVSILQDKAPALVESLLEARRSNHGLSLGDTVAMVGALERLIFDESLALLQASYAFNGLDAAEAIPQRSAHDVLTSYLVLFQLGSKANLTDRRLHHGLKAKLSQRSDWEVLQDFERDTLLNYNYAKRDRTNPFAPAEYVFEDMCGIVADLAHGYGKWQNTECMQMKDELVELDVDGDGRIPLKVFYGQQDNAKYQFSESVQYLQEIGALDESGEQKVRIANYLQGPSNCIASSSYYSICCLSECEGLVNELEAKVQAPAADPAYLLELVGHISSASVDAPRQLPFGLKRRLQDIADHNGGQVPLHGRLFAEWMHYAFPHECPYPKVFQESKILTPEFWAQKKMSVDAQERLEIASSAVLENTTDTDSVGAESAEIAWSSEELLHAQDSPVRKHGSARAALRCTMQLALLLGVLRAAAGSWQTLRDLAAPRSKAALPF